MKLVHATLLAALLALQACGGRSDNDSDSNTSDSDDTATGFYAPSYGDARSDTRWQADLSSVTERVVACQDTGSELASLITAVGDDLVRVFGDYKVKLISASKNSCPDDVDDCDTTDSAELGVGSSALVATLDGSKSTVRNQSERGTCVAFAFNAGMELLLARQDKDVELSEQNTYFEGKRLTYTWDSAGLSPYGTIDAFVGQKTKWVAESYWPYSGDDKYCGRYKNEYPNATCSETEAQGGGSDARQQDSYAAAADGYSLTTAH